MKEIVENINMFSNQYLIKLDEMEMFETKKNRLVSEREYEKAAKERDGWKKAETESEIVFEKLKEELIGFLTKLVNSSLKGKTF